MDPFTIAAIIGAGIQVVSSIVGELNAAGKRDEANQIRAAAVKAYGNIPELGPSALAGVHADPKYAAAQNHALDALLNVEKSGGMTLADRSNLADVENETAGRESADRGALTQNMASRGIGGSGADLALQSTAQQSAANRVADAGRHTAADAQARYLQSILSRGQLAGSLRSQDYGEQARAAEAQDAISRYNLDLKRDKAHVALTGAGQQADAATADANRATTQAQGVGSALATTATGVGGYMANQDSDAKTAAMLRRLLQKSSAPGDYSTDEYSSYGGLA